MWYNWIRSFGSIPTVGSSNKIKFGVPIKTHATPTRLWIPPEQDLNFELRTFSIFVLATACSTSLVECLSSPRSPATKLKISFTFRDGYTSKAWGRYANSFLNDIDSLWIPLKVIDFFEGRMPATNFRKVVFPLPFSPSKNVNPGRKVTLIFDKIFFRRLYPKSRFSICNIKPSKIIQEIHNS